MHPGHLVPVHLPAGALVVLAGLPGAGKTTLLRRLSGAPGVRALDAEDVAARLAGAPVPYRVVRPLVHALHLLRVLLVLVVLPGTVLTTDPMTSPVRRRLLHAAARATGRRLHVVLVDAAPEEAREGQRRRGRTLGPRRVRRHERRSRGLHAPGAVDVVLTRAEAACAAPSGCAASAQPLARPRAEAGPVGTRPTSRRRHDHRTRNRGRLVSASPAARRPATLLLTSATLLGLWLGLSAPDVSPVLPDAVPAAAVQEVGDGDGDGDRDGGRGGRR